MSYTSGLHTQLREHLLGRKGGRTQYHARTHTNSRARALQICLLNFIVWSHSSIRRQSECLVGFERAPLIIWKSKTNNMLLSAWHNTFLCVSAPLNFRALHGIWFIHAHKMDFIFPFYIIHLACSLPFRSAKSFSKFLYNFSEYRLNAVPYFVIHIRNASDKSCEATF